MLSGGGKDNRTAWVVPIDQNMLCVDLRLAYRQIFILQIYNLPIYLF